MWTKIAAAFKSSVNLYSMTASTIAFAITYLAHWVTANYLYILIGCAVVLLVCQLLRGSHPFTVKIMWPVGLFLVLTLFFHYYNYFELKAASRQELIADSTTSLVYFWENMVEQDTLGIDIWADDAIMNDEALFVLVPNSISRDQFISEVYDLRKGGVNIRGQMINLPGFWISESRRQKTDTKYNLVFMYKPYIRKEWSAKGCIVLPESALYTLKAAMYKKGRLYDESLALYKRADSLGNAGASYFLAEWYSIGYGVAPTIPLRNHYLQRAADGGSQLGRYFLGQKELIEDSSSGRVQVSIVLDQVRRAVRINTIDSDICRQMSAQACELLNTYYQSRGDYKSAYEATKLNVSQYESKDNADIRYGIHLDNCIMRKKYPEALDIIEKGKRGRRANCFIAHAYLLSNGLGCKKDVSRAETLLRFAADSLGEPKAYGALADLYEENGAPAGDVEFWRKLEEMGFNRSVK